MPTFNMPRKHNEILPSIKLGSNPSCWIDSKRRTHSVEGQISSDEGLSVLNYNKAKIKTYIV